MKSYSSPAAFFLLVVAAALPTPAPPNIPTAPSATTMLTNLIVAPQGPQDGYSRELFPHWITILGECDTRETVLKRDGTNVVTSSTCGATSGSWFSPYDGVTWSSASDVDIDHVVPLSNAWKVCTLAFPILPQCCVQCGPQLRPAPILWSIFYQVEYHG
jgi:hypothetical protein